MMLVFFISKMQRHQKTMVLIRLCEYKSVKWAENRIISEIDDSLIKQN